jgi:hypothetical protein
MFDYEKITARLFEAQSILLSEEGELTEAAAVTADVISSEELADQNDTNDVDVMFGFIDSVSARLQEFGLSEEDAYGFIVAAASELAEAGDMPSLPDEDSDVMDFSAWLAAARSADLEGLVYKSYELSKGQ